MNPKRSCEHLKNRHFGGEFLVVLLNWDSIEFNLLTLFLLKGIKPVLSHLFLNLHKIVRFDQNQSLCSSRELQMKNSMGGEKTH